MAGMTIWLRGRVARDTGKGGWKIGWLGSISGQHEKKTTFTSDSRQCGRRFDSEQGI